MNKILFCTDGSHYSEVSLEYACWLANHCRKDIDCLYVSSSEQFELSMIPLTRTGIASESYQAFFSQYQEMEALKSESIKNRVGELLREKGFQGKWEFIHKTGHIVDVIQSIEHDAEYVVLGKRGENANLAAGHLGGTMEKLIRITKKPCLLTASKFIEPKKILISYDGSFTCAKAVEHLVSHPFFKDLEMHIVTVLDDSVVRDKANVLIHQAVAVAHDAGVQPIHKILDGKIEDVVPSYAQKEGISLLVLGAHGHSRIRDFFVGSHSMDLIRACHIPVLLYR
ncbi:MAG: hypothetical protein COZ46_03570 [Verrucomicrobia bacterium CG_4_10_14_3_um_filter_43_23]|nr:MAG: hypothetical protein AUJ82_02715 [Verrucomicrobia bacterium CG1_02_43_26]PIP59172.1 MAG: hypothetical protein COX01_05120 [Verrucomicrobia bacterium CG22_combo_CG10-13_8_21_14_all_43_17]PIX58448.1 MAG: hypothetical protein COZ46_03570 [Verrucomicrobia bacterium CG_4_10_14_3_um_filter_43_23]PIY63171.1 MAG: hypothetical protein COY94_00035 [Verrucomicrobia bacterium CG_4_10_14_0_8_um_filter_43_34]PJA44890.1 MAG: hypothetical protein CO175_00515 [Verrucomicrobia bacterium CG_4_9_14_3_um_fi